jgi:ferredoxin-NADP reductase
VTPLVSMVETLADREDRRPVLLFHGAHAEDELTLTERLADLRTRLDLTVVPVLERPPRGWTGEVGLIDEDLIRRHLPHNHRRFQYFVCGPAPLMDSMEQVLPALGIPAGRIHAERFDMV